MGDPGRTPSVTEPPPGASAGGRLMTGLGSDRSRDRLYGRRLRDIHRSAGWPCCDAIEIDLLAAGLVQRMLSAQGHETLRLTDSGILFLAATQVRNRNAFSAHEALVEQVALEATRGGRIAWRRLTLRARIPEQQAGDKPRWCLARPDVFSIRNTSVEAYAEPVVHEVKVSRADLLGDLRKTDKRAAYLDLAAECWYVLGCDARGRAIASPEEIPAECGVMLREGARLKVARAAPRRRVDRIAFHVWLALAKAQPATGFDDTVQSMLEPCESASASTGMESNVGSATLH